MPFKPLLSKEFNSATPKYEQLYELLRDAILEGRLRAGDQLPATRELSQQLGVGRNAVVIAFEMLIAEGFLQAKQGSGTFVAACDPLIPLTDQKHTQRSKQRAIDLSARQRRISSGVQNYVTQQPRGIMMPAQPSLTRFPHKAWQRCIQQASRDAIYEPSDVMGDRVLRQELADFLKLTRGVQCQPDQIMLTSGSLHGIATTLQILVEPAESVLVENRGYQGIDAALFTIGAIPLPMPCDEQGVITDQLAVEQARVMILTPSRCFPIGGTLPIERRMALLERLHQQEHILIEDDYDSEFVFSGHSITALQGMDRSGRVIYTGTFSRTLFPSIRTGYLVLPDSLVSHFKAYRHATEGGMPILQQRAIGLFMQQGHYARHLRRMRKHYQSNRQRLIDFMAQHFPYLTPVLTSGGMHLVFRMSQYDQPVVDKLNAAGIGARSLSSYDRVPSKEYGIILGYAALEDQHLEQLRHALTRALLPN